MFRAEEYKKILAKSDSISDIEAVPLPMVREDQNYIFISYSHQDYKQVYSDLADMYEAGVRFWYDRGLTMGKDWDAVVSEKIQSPRCSGVIFYLSKNLFLSSAIKREISIVTGRDEITGQEISGAKGYFSVNLTDGAPSDIVFSITPAEKQEKKLDSRWLKLLMDTFSDESTYLPFAAPNHAAALVEAICDTFNVVNDPEVVVLAEGDYAGQTQNGRRHGKGTFTYTTGHVYEGQWENDLRCGNGTLSRNGKVVYAGQWKDDKYHGYGEFTYTDGTVYAGYWENGLRHGQGTCTYANGAIYEGQWENGQRHGQGVYIYGDKGENKRRYAGQWAEDRMEGVGRFTFSDQSTYEGEFADGKLHGYGVRKYNNGVIYEGQWRSDKRNGQGTYFYADGKSWSGEFVDDEKWNGKGFLYYYSNNEPTGKTYEGELAEGKRNGQGVCHYENGAVYEGQWKDGLRHGQGTYIYSDEGEHKRKYVGQWVEDRMEGRGVFTFADQGTYDGEFVDCKFHGYGLRKYASGNSYDGYWEQDKQCGQGVYTYQDGKTWTGIFKNGEKWTGKGFLYYYVNGKLNGETYEGELLEGKRHGWGVFHYKDGAVYEGQWKDGQRHGKGTYISASRLKYVGQWEDGKQNGQGVFTYQNGSVYEGQVVNGLCEGYGRRQYANGCSYEGQWKKDSQNGQGTYTYEDGMSWTGLFVDNKMWTGNGFWYYYTDGKRNGKTYDGEVVDGVPHGFGRYTFADGSFYEGEFVNGKRHGEGVYESFGLADDEGPTLRYQKGGLWVRDKLVEGWEASLRRGKDGVYRQDARKEGKWDYAGNPLGVVRVTTRFGTSKKLSLPGVAALLPNWKILKLELDKTVWQFESRTSATPNGEGKAICYDGTIIEGFFINGKVDENKPCTVTYTDGCVYKGTLEGGLRNGNGIMTASNGDRYDGRWVDSYLREGEVVIHNEDGSVYTGHWRDGRSNGWGKLEMPDGTIVSGIWEKGKLVRPDP